MKLRTAGFDDLRRVLAEELWIIEGVETTETQMAIYLQEVNDVAERRIEAIKGKKNPNG